MNKENIKKELKEETEKKYNIYNLEGILFNFDLIHKLFEEISTDFFPRTYIEQMFKNLSAPSFYSFNSINFSEKDFDYFVTKYLKDTSRNRNEGIMGIQANPYISQKMKDKMKTDILNMNIQMFEPYLKKRGGSDGYGMFETEISKGALHPDFIIKHIDKINLKHLLSRYAKNYEFEDIVKMFAAFRKTGKSLSDVISGLTKKDFKKTENGKYDLFCRQIFELDKDVWKELIIYLTPGDVFADFLIEKHPEIFAEPYISMILFRYTEGMKENTALKILKKTEEKDKNGSAVFFLLQIIAEHQKFTDVFLKKTIKYVPEEKLIETVFNFKITDLDFYKKYIQKAPQNTIINYMSKFPDTDKNILEYIINEKNIKKINILFEPENRSEKKVPSENFIKRHIDKINPAVIFRNYSFSEHFFNENIRNAFFDDILQNRSIHPKNKVKFLNEIFNYKKSDISVSYNNYKKLIPLFHNKRLYQDISLVSKIYELLVFLSDNEYLEVKIPNSYMLKEFYSIKNWTKAINQIERESSNKNEFSIKFLEIQNRIERIKGVNKNKLSETVKKAFNANIKNKNRRKDINI